MCSWWTADGWADSGGRTAAIFIEARDCDVQQSSSKLEQTSCTPTPATVDAALHDRAGGNLRWVICALLFFATRINYMDRQVLGLLAALLQKTFGWSEIQYGNIVQMFFYAYALVFIVMGCFIDRVGTRIGYAAALSVWSLSAMGHSLARSIFGFGTARFMLGLGESGNFSAAIKTVTEWFLNKERALATGIFIPDRTSAPWSPASRSVDRDALGLALGICLHRSF
jgi:hypothetical protein